MTWSLRSSASAVASYFGINRTDQSSVPRPSGESTRQYAEALGFQFVTPEQIQHPWPKYRCGRCGVIFKRRPQHKWFSLNEIYEFHRPVCEDAFVYRMGIHYGRGQFIIGASNTDWEHLTMMERKERWPVLRSKPA